MDALIQFAVNAHASTKSAVDMLVRIVETSHPLSRWVEVKILQNLDAGNVLVFCVFRRELTGFRKITSPVPFYDVGW